LTNLFALLENRTSVRIFRHIFASRNGSEVGVNQTLGHVRIEVTRDDQRRVLWTVPDLEEVLHVIECRILEVFVTANGGVMVGVPHRERELHEIFIGLTIRAVLVALTPLISNHLTLVVQLGLVQDGQEVPHSVALHEQCQRQLLRGNTFKIVGPLGVRGAVDTRSHSVERLKVFARAVKTPLEHQVLKQVREAREAFGLVL